MIVSGLRDHQRELVTRCFSPLDASDGGLVTGGRPREFVRPSLVFPRATAVALADPGAQFLESFPKPGHPLADRFCCRRTWHSSDPS
jgi:hypothetical protein